MVKKAVIPVAGLGTRFLPATKTVPKELLPIVDKPGLMYIAEEAIEAGIEDIIFIAGRNKEAIEDFFDVSYELENKLEQDQRLHLLEDLIQLREKANFISIRQQQPKGLGHAIYTAAPVIGSESFAVLLGDELSYGTEKATQSLVRAYQDLKSSVSAVMPVEKEQVSSYGIIDAIELSTGLFEVKAFVEKPKPEEAPSQYALSGRYIFPAEILEILKNQNPGRNNEIQLTDAMDSLCKKQKMYAKVCTAKRYDAGNKLGFLIANIEYALDREDLSEGLRAYLKELSKTL